MNWCVVPMMPATADTHVVPLDELSRHELDIGCWCGPRRDNDERRVVVHVDREGRPSS